MTSILKIPSQCILGLYLCTSEQHPVIRLTQNALKEQVWFLHKAIKLESGKIVNCLRGINRTKPVHLPNPTFGSNLA